MPRKKEGIDHFTITVDYRRSFSERRGILSLDWDLSRTANQLIRINGAVEKKKIVLVPIYKEMTVKELRQKFLQRRLVFATINEALALSAAYPYLQRMYHIVFLGTVFKLVDYHSPDCVVLGNGDQLRALGVARTFNDISFEGVNEHVLSAWPEFMFAGVKF